MPHPRPFTLFSLKPLNERAKKVVGHPHNRHLLTTLDDGTQALAIGFHIRSRSCWTLATLGRGDTDIYIEGSSISKIQCSFEINPATNVVMLYDRSHGHTTQVFGENATQFEHGRPRQVVVQEKLNETVGMGGIRQDLVRFKLVWCLEPAETMERIRDRDCLVPACEENPRFARTMDEEDTAMPSQRETRIHTPASCLKVRYIEVIRLGSGAFGTVSKAINVDTGNFMAVKVLQGVQPASKAREYQVLKREVETLSRISHPHIVDYIASQGWETSKVEIFMGLKEGTLQSLVEDGQPFSSDLATSLFHQMLQALDCLASCGIIHRDVKPENILYTSKPNEQYQFQLGDFGLCNRAVSAVTCCGTPLYMAPEIFQSGNQTHKVDVWSLCVTMLWTLNPDGFRQRLASCESVGDIPATILVAVSSVQVLEEMAVKDPNKRASAAQLLVRYFDGKGLTTQRHRVSPVVETGANEGLVKMPRRRSSLAARQAAHRPRVDTGRRPPQTPALKLRLAANKECRMKNDLAAEIDPVLAC